MSRDAGSIPAASTRSKGLRDVASLLLLVPYVMWELSHLRTDIGSKWQTCQIHSAAYLTQDLDPYLVKGDGVS